MMAFLLNDLFCLCHLQILTKIFLTEDTSAAFYHVASFFETHFFPLSFVKFNSGKTQKQTYKRKPITINEQQRQVSVNQEQIAI